MAVVAIIPSAWSDCPAGSAGTKSSASREVAEAETEKTTAISATTVPSALEIASRLPLKSVTATTMQTTSETIVRVKTPSPP